MGKGDKKSKKGKISMGSFGVSRPSKSNLRQAAKANEKPVVAKAKPAKAETAKAPAPAKAAKAPAAPKAEAAKPAKKEAAAKK